METFDFLQFLVGQERLAGTCSN